MKAAFEQAVRDSEFHVLAASIIHEVHGDFERGDFDGISSMAPFFARRKNIVRVILAEKNVRCIGCRLGSGVGFDSAARAKSVQCPLAKTFLTT